MARIDRLLRKAIRSRFLITLVDEDAFVGVVVDADHEHLVLADAAHIDAEGKPVPAETQLWIPRSQVKYMQEIRP